MRQLTVRLLVAASLGAGVVSCAGSDDADPATPDSAPATSVTDSVEPVPSAEVVETTELAPTTEVPESTESPVTTDASDQLIVLV